MKKQLTYALGLMALIFMAVQTVSSQTINFPRPSPATTVKQGFATSFVEINYSRPSLKGRTIFGNIVPYNQVWRTGANAATTIELGQDMSLGGKAIPAGKYGFLTIPGETEWTIIISKDLNVTSANAYKKENDVARISVPVIKLEQPVETFTIGFSNITDTSMNLYLKWEKVKIKVPVVANYDASLTEQIEKVMATDSRPYYAAASYYYANNKDLAQALNWIRIANEQAPNRYWIQTLKAKIEFANNLFADAVETARLAAENAEKAGNMNYANEMKELIAEAEKQPGYKAPKKKKR